MCHINFAVFSFGNYHKNLRFKFRFLRKQLAKFSTPETEYLTILVGLAWTGTICQTPYSTSILESKGLMTYDASVAAHELGHR